MKRPYLARPVVLPHGKQIVRPGPDRCWALVPDWRSERLWLQEHRRERTPLSDYPAAARLLVGDYDPAATQSALLCDDSGALHLARSDDEGLLYERYAAAAVVAALQAGEVFPAPELRWSRPGAELGDMALLPDGGILLALCRERQTLALARPDLDEVRELTTGAGFRPPALHLEGERLTLAWADGGGRLYVQELPSLAAAPSAPEVLGHPFCRPSLLGDGSRLWIACEDLYNEIHTFVRREGEWTQIPLTVPQPRFTVDVSHSAHLSRDAHGVVWLFFADANRCHTYFARWLGDNWSPIQEARGLFGRSPYYDTNLLPPDFFTVEKHPAGDEFALLLGNAATGETALETLPVPAPVARPGGRVLFLDLLETAELRGLERVQLPPEKDPANPVFTPSEQPGTVDSLRVFNHGTVLREGDRFRMWYAGLHNRLPEAAWWHWVGGGYAESADGLTWERGDLGGGRGNEFPQFPLAPGVFRDDADPDPARRYKLIEFLNSGLQTEAALAGEYDLEASYYPGYLYTSPDGLTWQREPLRVEFPGGRPLSFVPMCLFRDDQDPDPARRWKAYGFTSLTYRRRAGALACSPDALHWTAYARNPVLEPRVSRQPITPAGQLNQIHDLVVWPQAGLYLALFQDQRTPSSLTLELAVSRDGEHFTCVAPGEAFIPEGPPGAWDEREALPAIPVEVGEETWFFYGASSAPAGADDMEHRCCAGLARSRRDGFTCLQPPPGCAGGSLTTVPFALAAPVRLLVNAFCPPGTRLRVEVLSEVGERLPGYALDDCAPLTGDAPYAPVTWAGGAALPGAGRVRFRFALEGAAARLYSFGFAEA